MRAWQELISGMKLIGTPYPNTEAELCAFEDTNNIQLPLEYREYCKVFGGGDFNEIIKVFCIAHTVPAEDLISEQRDFKFLLKMAFRDYPLVQQIIDTSFIFAFGIENNDLSFLFDFSSYDHNQESCNIYVLNRLTYSYYNLGCSFYRFTYDFCITETARQEFPDLLCDDNFIYTNTFICHSL
jgi:hypothetical protein